MNQKLTKRWIIAFCGILIQIILGSIYAWSVFNKPLMGNHWKELRVLQQFLPSYMSEPEFLVGLTFALTNFFLGFSAALCGHLVDKTGSRKIAIIGGILFSGGILIAGLAAQFNSLVLLWVGYGIITGIGAGLGYITPVAVLARWFPEKKGFIIGLAVMGFGLGGAFMSLIAPILIDTWQSPNISGVAFTFYSVGFIFLIVLPLAAQLQVNPPIDHLVEIKNGKKAPSFVTSFTLAKAKTTLQLYILWGILFFNVAAGLALIANLSNMAQENLKITAVTAGWIVTAGSFCNGFGRIFWGGLSEKLGQRKVFLLIFSTQIPLFILLPHVASFWVFTLIACWVLLCYGGGFGTMPSFTAETFGSNNIGAIYGIVLSAWGVAGGVGPVLMQIVKNITKTTENPVGSFDIALYIAAGLLVAGLVLLLLYHKPKIDDEIT